MHKLKIIIVSAIYFATASSAIADFKKNQIAKVGKITCGFSKSWFPISKSKGKYIKISKPTSAQKTACKTLVAPSKVNLAKLPDISQIAKSRADSSENAHVNAVSGTPPSLSEIVTTGPATVFWRSGIVSSIASGSPSADQCNEFFTGSNDGESGGFLSCYMNQNAGLALTEVVRAGTTMCYLKNMPTNEVEQAGGFTVTRGSLPGGSVTRLFETPTGSTPRIVRISLSAGGENGSSSDGIIKIFSSDQIARSGDIYKYEMIFCEGDASQPQEIEKTRITSGGEFISTSYNTSEGGAFSGSVRAFLRNEAGSLVFDNTRSRTATFSSTRNEGGSTSSSKSEIEINASNEIISKEYGIFPEDTRKAYSISRFSGTGTSSLRFFEGAIKQTFAYGDFNGATEYRDSYYASTPTNSYLSSLEAVDLTSDSFYQGTPSVSEGTSSINCSANADIEVSVNMENDTMRSVTAQCEGERIDGVDFCQSEELTQALQRYSTVCALP